MPDYPLRVTEITLSSLRWITLSVLLAALLTASRVSRALAPTDSVPYESLPPDVIVETVVANAEQVVAMDFTPDGRLLYTERTGKVRVVVDDVLSPTPVYPFLVNTQGERGLLGIAVDPAFESNHLVWVYLTRPLPDNVNFENRVVRFVLPDNNQAAETSRVQGFPVDRFVTIHNGGNLHFGPDGKLYVTVGDNTYPGQPTPAQTITSPLGKMHRFTPGDPLTVPADNPWPGRSLFAYGLRNSFDFDFDPVSGALFATENGPDCDDELNRLLPGYNYGWRTAYPCDDAAGPNPAYNTLPPLAYWTPSLAPTGLAFYTGDLIPEWKNDLFMCSYKDTTTAIHHFKLNAARTAIVSHTILSDTQTFQPVVCRTDLLTGPAGELYYSQGGGYPENNGPIKRLTRRTSFVQSEAHVLVGRAVAGGQAQVQITLRHHGTLTNTFFVNVDASFQAQVIDAQTTRGTINAYPDAVAWSGTVSGLETVTATYTLQLADTPTSTYLLTNLIQISAPDATSVTLTPLIIVNGQSAYLPIVWR